MFRPAGFRPFAGGPASAITDCAIPLADLSREFSALIGMPPRQYALACRA